ncbi:hypothetical protein PO883_32725 [Massilia sp. DJPM01]|uniref:hypothetical protein n=1 Tax=Massilia sp. DJPM01 TaxID=3024404 RepID=UPI00259EE735|nr:hypothetical protein [Massilia sp. DJPM01]MDM5181939.1 hypothetical protein [Massilia sp. DJPM01]
MRQLRIRSTLDDIQVIGRSCDLSYIICALRILHCQARQSNALVGFFLTRKLMCRMGKTDDRLNKQFLSVRLIICLVPQNTMPPYTIEAPQIALAVYCVHIVTGECAHVGKVKNRIINVGCEISDGLHRQCLMYRFPLNIPDTCRHHFLQIYNHAQFVILNGAHCFSTKIKRAE